MEGNLDSRLVCHPKRSLGNKLLGLFRIKKDLVSGIGYVNLFDSSVDGSFSRMVISSD